MDILTTGSVADQGVGTDVTNLWARSEDVGHDGAGRTIRVDLWVHVFCSPKTGKQSAL